MRGLDHSNAESLRVVPAGRSEWENWNKRRVKMFQPNEWDEVIWAGRARVASVIPSKIPTSTSAPRFGGVWKRKLEREEAQR